MLHRHNPLSVVVYGSAFISGSGWMCHTAMWISRTLVLSSAAFAPECPAVRRPRAWVLERDGNAHSYRFPALLTRNMRNVKVVSGSVSLSDSGEVNGELKQPSREKMVTGGAWF